MKSRERTTSQIKPSSFDESTVSVKRNQTQEMNQEFIIHSKLDHESLVSPPPTLRSSGLTMVDSTASGASVIEAMAP